MAVLKIKVDAFGETWRIEGGKGRVHIICASQNEPVWERAEKVARGWGEIIEEEYITCDPGCEAPIEFRPDPYDYEPVGFESPRSEIGGGYIERDEDVHPLWSEAGR